MFGDEHSATGVEMDGLSYVEVVISGLRCLEWRFPELPDGKEEAKKERGRRRRYKDLIGSANPDTPMLDTKKGRNGTEYCDIILITDHLEKWMQIMDAHLKGKGYSHSDKTVGSSSIHVTWSDGDAPKFTVNFYTTKGKFMIQPGSRDPNNLTLWLSCFDAMKAELPVDQQDTAEDEDDEDDESVAHDDSTNVQRAATPTAPSLSQLNPEVSEYTVGLPQNTMADDTRSLVGMVKSLMGQMTDLHFKIDRNNDNVTELSNMNSKLSEENGILRKQVLDLTREVNKLTWKSFRDPKQKDNVLMGSSIIRDVSDRKLVNTEVVCKPGGTTETIKSELDKLTGRYDNITLVVGGNDCDAKPQKPAEAIVNSLMSVADSAAMKAETVTISSICPRLTSTVTQEKITAVNAGLLANCMDREKVSFVDSTLSFTLGDGSINDGYFHPDGVHITKSAMNKLAKNLKLKVKDNIEGVCRDNSREKQKKQPPSKTEGEWNTVRHHRQTRNIPRLTTNGRCTFCAEVGHSQTACRHGQPVECHKCHQQGHKAKFCEQTY